VTAAPHRHVPDERLLACSFVETDAGSRTPAEAAAFAHLTACPACRRRYEALLVTVAALRAEENSETDAQFPADRLEAQRGYILRRLEALGQRARVLPFPGRRVQGSPAGARPSLRPARWAAVAAAAGLLVGLSLGWFMDLQLPWTSGPAAPAFVSARPVPGMHATGETAAEEDEELLAAVAEALMRQRTVELEALDAFTPRVRETTVVLR